MRTSRGENRGVSDALEALSSPTTPTTRNLSIRAPRGSPGRFLGLPPCAAQPRTTTYRDVPTILFPRRERFIVAILLQLCYTKGMKKPTQPASRKGAVVSFPAPLIEKPANPMSELLTAHANLAEVILRLEIAREAVGKILFGDRERELRSDLGCWLSVLRLVDRDMEDNHIHRWEHAGRLKREEIERGENPE